MSHYISTVVYIAVDSVDYVSGIEPGYRAAYRIGAETAHVVQ